MSTQTEITRLQTARNTIRTKLVDLGLVQSTAKLDACATAVDGIANRGAVSATVQEGDTYTIPAGYHNGSGTVSGVAGGGNYSLQSKSITPTKSQQSVTPDSGYYGLSDVTVAAIPGNYADVSIVTAGAADVLANKVIVDADGATVAGTMPNNGAVNKTLDASAGNQSYTVPKGYHSGAGIVKIVLEEKSATPTKSAQTITPTAGSVLSKVSVGAIPDNYIDTTDADATADDILIDKTAYVDGAKVTGVMADNGTVTKKLDASTGNQSYTIPAGKHSGLGKVSITLETKSATPTKSAQTITPTAGSVLSKVSVGAIPDAYQDVTGVTASAEDVLVGKTIVDASGAEVAGSMPDNGTVSKTLDATADNQSFTIPAGKHSGLGAVSIALEEKSATPTKSAQTITPATGKVLSKVSIGAIPDAYQDVTEVTATAADVLAGKKIVSSTGAVISGAMANNGSIAATIDGLSVTSYTVPAGYHSGSGTVSLTNDIELALAAI